MSTINSLIISEKSNRSIFQQSEHEERRNLYRDKSYLTECIRSGSFPPHNPSSSMHDLLIEETFNRQWIQALREKSAYIVSYDPVHRVIIVEPGASFTQISALSIRRIIHETIRNIPNYQGSTPLVNPDNSFVNPRDPFEASPCVIIQVIPRGKPLPPWHLLHSADRLPIKPDEDRWTCETSSMAGEELD